MGRSVSRRQLRLAPGNASGFGQAKSREPGEPPRVEVTANGASFWFPPDVGCDPRADGGRCAGHGVATVEIAVHVDERQGPAGRCYAGRVRSAPLFSDSTTWPSASNGPP